MTSSDTNDASPWDVPEDRSETLTQMLDAVPSAIGFWGRDLCNVFANRAYFEWFGVTPEQMRGQHALAVLGQVAFEGNLPFMQRALAGERQVFERVLQTPSGEIRSAQIDYTPYHFHGEVVGFIAVIVDVSERTLAERAARGAAEELATLAERRRIEERAHAGVLQDLFAVQLRIERARASVTSESPAAEILDSALDRLDAAVADLRLVLGVDPSEGAGTAAESGLAIPAALT
ncbi:MAG TPA: PAS domain-containing protein [Jatrophihabitans sp.]|nr:PAS domain-containing protein [Jatrophihabitans sp.]